MNTLFALPEGYEIRITDEGLFFAIKAEDRWRGPPRRDRQTAEADAVARWNDGRVRKAFKFIAEQTPVPDVGVYSGCATVVIAESVEGAREAIKDWAAKQTPPDDVRWIDHCSVWEVPLETGAVLLFVMQ